MRRKGEQKLDRQFFWSDGCCIERAIRTGDCWLDAWTRQQTVNQAELTRATGMTVERVNELRHGKAATSTELDALAAALRTDLASLQAAIAYEREIDMMPF